MEADGFYFFKYHVFCLKETGQHWWAPDCKKYQIIIQKLTWCEVGKGSNHHEKNYVWSDLISEKTEKYAQL